MSYFQFIIIKLLNVYSVLIILRAVISWFSPDPYNPLYHLLIRLTEPVLGRIRRLLPTSGIDFSPFIALILIELIANLIR
ncbi:MAG: hypothetical protein B6D62_04190 [Candidatus Cloacimonas sp. 4484_275]|nr:MAG: hypothetical protein B6D62_04190 [Candidatus Cloacimonas sp. 4484_275]RLC51450.1 MAG: YggT family protein [Candidatus Cloacimonadota bacterium]